MKTRHLIIPILLFGITVCSCKKNDSDNNSTRKNMLIAKWKYTHFAWDSNNNKLPDDSFHAVPDSISYYYDIKSNGQVDISDNGQLTTIPWSLQENETKFQLGGSITYDIQELTNGKLSLGSDMTSPYAWYVYTKQQ